ncbi:DNA ligase 1 [Halotydeus destructor]|nr:DNA ligase 1 [Halotydeus destructor]
MASQPSILSFFKRDKNTPAKASETPKKVGEKEKAKSDSPNENRPTLLNESYEESPVKARLSLKRRVLDSDDGDSSAPESSPIKQAVFKAPKSKEKLKVDQKSPKKDSSKKWKSTVSKLAEASSPVKDKKALKDKATESSEEATDEGTDDSSSSPVKKEKYDGPANTIEKFNPSIVKYDPIRDAPWSAGQKIPYIAFCKTLLEIEGVSSRLKMIEILANYFSSVILLTPEDLLPSIYLCLNKLAPDYEGIELGIGESLIIKAVAEATGRKSSAIKTELEKKGDLGVIAESSRQMQRVMFAPPKLHVSDVFKKLKEVALMAGQASAAKKLEKVKSLIVSCKDCEARYLVRSLSGKLRIGLAEQSLLVALAQAVVLSENRKLKRGTDSFKNKADHALGILKNAYCECPNYDEIVRVLLEHGIEELPEHCKITPGIPLKPMLAHPTKGVDEVLRRFENNLFTCEYKYDGERAQVHLTESGQVRIYSRNQEDNTTKYPDIISRVPQVIREETKSFIIDAEAVAWDIENQQILPFQVLSTRKRKDVKEEDIKVKVCIFAFDILYFNGRSLTKEPLRERRKCLQDAFHFKDDQCFMFVQHKDVTTTDEIQELIDIAVKDRCEGLMVKCLDDDVATYEIAKRSRNWLKLKKDYLEGVGDTLDLAVVGAWFGKGKRTGAYGGYLLACYDEENEEFQTICKIGTGFSDDDLEKHNASLKAHIIPAPKSYYNWDEGVKPDVWFDAVQVWEVKCADLSISPVHRAGMGKVDPEKGISLRFPRFIRIRDDKKPEDATSAEQVAQMYSNQEAVKKNVVDDDDLDD